MPELEGRELQSVNTARHESDGNVENEDRGEGPSTSSGGGEASSSREQGSSVPPAQERPQARQNKPPRPLQAEASFDQVVRGVPIFRNSMRSRQVPQRNAGSAASRVQSPPRRLGAAPLRRSIPQPPLFQASASTSTPVPAPARPANTRPLKRRRAERDDSDPEVDDVEAEEPEEEDRDEQDVGERQADDEESGHGEARPYNSEDQDPQRSSKHYRRRT